MLRHDERHRSSDRQSRPCRFGAVGTPIWYGLDGIGLTHKELQTVGWKSQVMLTGCAHIVPLLAASFIVRWRDLIASWPFVLLSIWAAQGPALGLAIVSTDFSSFIGGMIAVCIIGALSHFKIGLGAHPGHKFEVEVEGASEPTKEIPDLLQRKWDTGTTQLSSGQRCTTRSNELYDNSTSLAAVPPSLAHGNNSSCSSISNGNRTSSAVSLPAPLPACHSSSSAHTAPQHRSSGGPVAEALERQVDHSELHHRLLDRRHTADGPPQDQELIGITIEQCPTPAPEKLLARSIVSEETLPGPRQWSVLSGTQFAAIAPLAAALAGNSTRDVDGKRGAT
jgi:hypothetical protein